MGEIHTTDSWNRFLGDNWATMLRYQQVNPFGTVVEIGPGFADKIACGLAALDFRGTLVVVEPNEAASVWVLKRYRALLPHAEVLIERCPIRKSKIPHERSVDALLSNHLLDDLLLHAALPAVESVKIFSSMRPNASCSQIFIRKWHEILTRSNPLENLIIQVAEDFANYVTKMQPGLVLLNQYASWRHNQHGLSAIHTQALKLMQLLEASLQAVCIDTVSSAASHYQSSVRWLIGKPNSYREK